jgi:hypothetical protein
VFSGFVDWSEFYSEAEEVILKDTLEPRGVLVVTSCFVDSDHSGFLGPDGHALGKWSCNRCWDRCSLGTWGTADDSMGFSNWGHNDCTLGFSGSDS